MSNGKSLRNTRCFTFTGDHGASVDGYFGGACQVNGA